jgi:hypothetical protein
MVGQGMHVIHQPNGHNLVHLLGNINSKQLELKLQQNKAHLLCLNEIYFG